MSHLRLECRIELIAHFLAHNSSNILQRKISRCHSVSPYL